MDFSILAGTAERPLSSWGTFSEGDQARCGNTPYKCQNEWYITWTIGCDRENDTWRLSSYAYQMVAYCFDSPCSNLIYLYYGGATPIDLAIEDDGKLTGSYTVELNPDQTSYVCPEECRHICGNETVTLTVEFNP